MAPSLQHSNNNDQKKTIFFNNKKSSKKFKNETKLKTEKVSLYDAHLSESDTWCLIYKLILRM